MKKIAVFSLLFLLIFASCGSLTNMQPPVTPTEIAQDAPEELPEKEPVSYTLRIVAAGDNLIHNTLSFNAKTDGGFDFRPMYEPISDTVKSADIAFINQEIMLTGEINGYPTMSAPFEVADAVLDAGFNVVNLATNHSLDRGEEGLSKCLEYVNNCGFSAVLGAFSSEEDSQKLTVIEKNGLKIGFLSYTYGLNGFRLKKGNEWKIALIDEEKISAEVQKIRPLCDYLIVSMHWGQEYTHKENEQQKKLAQLLCDNGVDLIIGTHPHVIQPIKTLTSENGHTAVCAYSLGNLVAHQNKLATLLGGLLDISLVFDENKALCEQTVSVIPTVTHFNSSARGFKIYPLSEYTSELADKHGIKKYGGKALTLEYLQSLSDEIFGELAK